MTNITNADKFFYQRYVDERVTDSICTFIQRGFLSRGNIPVYAETNTPDFTAAEPTAELCRVGCAHVRGEDCLVYCYIIRDDKMREKAVDAYSVLLAVMGCDTRNVLEYGQHVLVLAFPASKKEGL